MLYACKGAHTLFTGQGEREKGREKEKDRCRICPALLFLFLKGIMGSLAPFSYLVCKINRRDLASYKLVVDFLY
jgi:hypothetical protein